MSALDDPEDDKPLAPPPTVPEHEIPPQPLMDAFRSAETEPPFPPAPGLPASLMATEQARTTEPAPEAIADVVLERLERFLEPHLKNIFGKLDELYRLRETDSSKLQAVDNGMAGVFTALGQLEDAVRTTSDATLANASAVNDLREAIAKQSTFDKSRLATAELLIDANRERIDDHAERIQRIERAAGE